MRDLLQLYSLSPTLSPTCFPSGHGSITQEAGGVAQAGDTGNRVPTHIIYLGTLVKMKSSIKRGLVIQEVIM